jgi:hypothetical protein
MNVISKKKISEKRNKKKMAGHHYPGRFPGEEKISPMPMRRKRQMIRTKIALIRS